MLIITGRVLFVAVLGDASAADVERRGIADGVRHGGGSHIYILLRVRPAVDAANAAGVDAAHPSQFTRASYIPDCLHIHRSMLLFHVPDGGGDRRRVHSSRRANLLHIRCVAAQSELDG